MAESHEIIINVKDFSTSPGPRYVKQGEDSGELFYHQKLNPSFIQVVHSDKKIVVNLDGVDGYMSSFLDEAFGNLVFDFGLETIKDKISFISTEEPEWIDMLINDTYPEWEKRRKKKILPKITQIHSDWKRIENGELVDVNYAVAK